MSSVGAHREHLATSNWHKAVTCEDCHLRPSLVDDPDHIDTDLPVELTYGGLATANGAVPSFNGDNCSNYCHGQTLIAGGGNTTPSWTTVDNTQDACGTCLELLRRSTARTG